MNTQTVEPTTPSLRPCLAPWAQFLDFKCQCQNCVCIGQEISFMPPQDVSGYIAHLQAYSAWLIAGTTPTEISLQAPTGASPMLLTDNDPYHIDSQPGGTGWTSTGEMEPSPITSLETPRRPAVLPLNIPPSAMVADTETPSTAVDMAPIGFWQNTVKQDWSPTIGAGMANGEVSPPSIHPMTSTFFHHHHYSPTTAQDHVDWTPSQPEAGSYLPVIPGQALVETGCRIIVPAAAHVPCPCCPPEKNCGRRFLHTPDGKLPADLLEHARQQDIIIPPRRQPAGDLYPQCNFPGCQDRPKYPWYHISNRHLESLPWKCACTPAKVYASRNSVNNHLKRVARQGVMPVIQVVRS